MLATKAMTSPHSNLTCDSAIMASYDAPLREQLSEANRLVFAFLHDLPESGTLIKYLQRSSTPFTPAQDSPEIPM